MGMAASFIAIGCNRQSEEHQEGRWQAERDIAKGEFKIAFFDGSVIDTNGPASFYDYTGLLRTRYNIGWCSYSLPANPRAAEEWVRGYNEVARPEVERRIGAQVL